VIAVARVNLTLALCAAALAAALAGCGGSSTSPTSSSSSTAAGASGAASTPSSSASSTTASVSTATLPALGQALVDAQGRTLYIFLPDRHAKVTCTGACAQLWPPAKLLAGQMPSASGAAKSSLLGSAADPEGGRVVTYAGWPLYTYVGDSSPGSSTGEGLSTNGGRWYVIAPSGQAITKTS
jgi:predicted lipoprotein with Yx(FWY)xxD motif